MSTHPSPAPSARARPPRRVADAGRVSDDDEAELKSEGPRALPRAHTSVPTELKHESSPTSTYTVDRRTFVRVKPDWVEENMGIEVDDLVMVDLDDVVHFPPPAIQRAHIHGFVISKAIDGAIMDAWTTGLRRPASGQPPAIHVLQDGDDEMRTPTHVYARNNTVFYRRIETEYGRDMITEAGFHGFEIVEVVGRGFKLKQRDDGELSAQLPIDEDELVRSVKESVRMFGGAL